MKQQWSFIPGRGCSKGQSSISKYKGIPSGKNIKLSIKLKGKSII